MTVGYRNLMDPFDRTPHKALTERPRRHTSPPETAPPPPYSPPYTDEEMDSDQESDDGPYEEPSTLPLKLTIDASNSVQGSNNLVPTSPTQLPDAAKISSLLLHAVNQINQSGHATSGGRSPLQVDLTINCGNTIVGDRNVIGNVGLRHGTPTAGFGSPIPGPQLGGPVTIGAKRKVVDEDRGDEHSSKRIAPERDAGD